MREPNVDPAKLRRLAQRLTLREFEWLRDTVWFCDHFKRPTQTSRRRGGNPSGSTHDT